MKNRKLVMVLGLVGAMGISAIATPVLQDIKAVFNPTIKYTLNGEEVLEGKGALVFEDTIYLPIRDAATVLGVGVDYQDKTVILSTEAEVEEVVEMEKLTEAKEADVIDAEKIIEAEEVVEMKELTEAKKADEEEADTEEVETETEEVEETEEEK